jgi:hypothetical protein
MSTDPKSVEIGVEDIMAEQHNKEGETGKHLNSTDDEPNRIEELAAANRELRERVDELEDALTEVTTALAEGDETAELATSGGQPTKVIGRLSDTDGIGVLGEATGSGATNGVRGVASSSSGYGLYTPDDAKVDGDIEAGGFVDAANIRLSGQFNADKNFQVYIDGSRNVFIEPQTNNDEAGNVVFGAIPNYNDTTAAHGATVSGGGIGGQSPEPNLVHDNFGTVGGGKNNTAGRDNGSSTGAQYATVPGGLENTASGYCSFAAGRQAKAQDDGAFVFGDSTTTQVTSSNADEARFQMPVHTTYVDAAEGYRGAIGSSAYLAAGANFSVTSTAQRIPFDTLAADQRNEFDTSNNYFECAHDGAYVVEIGLESANNSTTSGDVELILDIMQGNAGSNPASDQGIVWNFEPNGNNVARTFTKTIFGLNAGNRIAVEISDSAGNLELTGSANETFFMVRQVGGGGENTSSPVSNNTPSTEESND